MPTGAIFRSRVCKFCVNGVSVQVLAPRAPGGRESSRQASALSFFFSSVHCSQVPGLSQVWAPLPHPTPANRLQIKGQWVVDVGGRRWRGSQLRFLEAQSQRGRSPAKGPSIRAHVTGWKLRCPVCHPHPRPGGELRPPPGSVSPCWCPASNSLSLFRPRLSSDSKAPDKMPLHPRVFPGSVHEGRGRGGGSREVGPPFGLILRAPNQAVKAMTLSTSLPRSLEGRAWPAGSCPSQGGGWDMTKGEGVGAEKVLPA